MTEIVFPATPSPDEIWTHPDTGYQWQWDATIGYWKSLGGILETADPATGPAFDKANTANVTAHFASINATSAFAQANSEPIGVAAFGVANTSNTVAIANVNYVNTAMQAAFGAANTSNTVAIANVNYVNTAMQAAFSKANSANNLAKTGTINYVIDGGGSAITVGAKAPFRVGFAGTITGCHLMGDQTGSIVVDIWKDTLANHPPTNADTITGGNEPTISSGTKDSDVTLTSWTTSFSANDVFMMNVDSVSTFTQVTVSLDYIKT